MKFIRHILVAVVLIVCTCSVEAQIYLGESQNININYQNPKTYEIGGITISGVQYLEHSTLIGFTGLHVGDKIDIPGQKISKAIDKLWRQGLFEDIRIEVTKVQGNLVFLNIDMKERPRISTVAIEGIKKSELTDLKGQIGLTRGDVVSENSINNAKNAIRTYFIDKGYYNIDIDVVQEDDPLVANSKFLSFKITKNKKTHINDIVFSGNENVASRSLRHSMKETKQMLRIKPFEHFNSSMLALITHPKRLFTEGVPSLFMKYMENRVRLSFKSSKYIDNLFTEDKQRVIDKYNELGYRDAYIEADSVQHIADNLLNVYISVNEGKKYYFRNISWTGNTLYSSERLSQVLNIKKGETYNQTRLLRNLMMNPEGTDVSSLYTDNGYLFFNAEPVEVLVENDSIDIEIRIREGEPTNIGKVTISGNTRTNDYVILRELRTIPGDKFSRAEVIRTQRELAQLRYFNQESIQPEMKPNPQNGTVDIEWKLEETSSDQLELSGGYGSSTFVGSIGVSFNNFSAKKFFKGSAWRPVPSGDGQKLSLRFQTNGDWYNSFNISFCEPWLGGHRPNALTTSVFFSKQTNGYSKSNANHQGISIFGISTSLSQRLKWPDDYFSFTYGLSYQRYMLDNYSTQFVFSDGYSNNINLLLALARNSSDAPIYPRRGSDISISAQLTPPFSMLNGKDYSTMTDQEKYKWLEYHKWKISSSFFLNFFDNFVLNVRAKAGYLCSYTSKTGDSPFERFYLGGDGLSGFSLDGRELIGMRGYGNNTLTTVNGNGYIGSIIFDKFTAELRYPVTLNPSATIYLLSFFEAGRTWDNYSSYNPFNRYRSAGLGVRIYMPMFGTLGLDWGYGFDEVPGVSGANGGQFHFSINQSID